MEIFVFKNFVLNKNYYEKFSQKKRKCIGIKGELFIELFIQSTHWKACYVLSLHIQNYAFLPLLTEQPLS